MAPVRRSYGGLFLLVTSCVALAQPKTQRPPSLPVPSAPATLESIIERVRPSVVRIVVKIEYHIQERPEMFSESVSGTGFVVDSAGHVATAGHLVSLALLRQELKQQILNSADHLVDDSVHITSIEVLLPEPSKQDSNGNTFYDNNNAVDASVLAKDDMVDVAVLVCDRNPLTLRSAIVIEGTPLRPPAQVPALQTTPPHDGDMISVSGFPLGIPVLVTNTGWIASAFFIDERGRSLYLADISVNHGNSGGPAYSDIDGRVIGCVTEYRPAPEGNSRLTVIVPIQRVLDLLNTIKAN